MDQAEPSDPITPFVEINVLGGIRPDRRLIMAPKHNNRVPPPARPGAW
jgi:hypothetical protein